MYARDFFCQIYQFLHIFFEYLHTHMQKKAVILQRELISGFASVEKQEHLTQK